MEWDEEKKERNEREKIRPTGSAIGPPRRPMRSEMTRSRTAATAIHSKYRISALMTSQRDKPCHLLGFTGFYWVLFSFPGFS